jgi:surface antigen
MSSVTLLFGIPRRSTGPSGRAGSPSGGPNYLQVGIIGLCSICLTACAIDGSKQENGTLIGAGAGAAAGAGIGKLVGGDKGALIGGVIGLLVGSVVGNEIGRKLDENDRKKLEESRREALASNQAQSFYAASAHSQVTVEPTRSFIKADQHIQLDGDVTPVAMTIVLPNVVSAYVDTPVYRSPDFSGSPKMLIAKGATITTIATVDQSNWVLIGLGQYGIGYVPMQFLDPSIAQQLSDALAAPQPTTAPPRRSHRQHAPQKPNDGPGNTDRLLRDSGPWLPPRDHMTGTTTSSSDYSSLTNQGVETVRAAAGGDGDAQARLTAASVNVQCRDLTTSLLSDNRVVAKETSTNCILPAGVSS